MEYIIKYILTSFGRKLGEKWVLYQNVKRRFPHFVKGWYFFKSKVVKMDKKKNLNNKNCRV